MRLECERWRGDSKEAASDSPSVCCNMEWGTRLYFHGITMFPRVDRAYPAFRKEPFMFARVPANMKGELEPSLYALLAVE